MKLTLKKGSTYIPEWNENRNLPKDEQIKVDFEYLTASDKESFFVSGEKGTSTASVVKHCWTEKVKKIHNLEIEVDGEMVEATPDNILNLPDTFELFTEVATHIFTASSLDEEQLKN